MKHPGTCPLPDVLETLATGACLDGEVAAHVDACEVCRATVEEIRKDNQFLAGVRTALAGSDPAGSARAPSPEPHTHAAPLEPDLIHGYEIQEELHRGGQGVVYRAIQTRTRRTVAIKMLLGWHGANARQKERFEREIRIAAALRHPNIVTVHDSGYVGDGRYGLVMEYIEGATLDRWSRSLDAGRGRDARRLALRTRLGVMSKVCDAVLCAHQRSIVHRDLKPANILVDAAGEPHVLDFGIARDTAAEQHTRLTHTGEFAGTLAYASPEQVSGDLSRVDTRSDVYSLGVILYELASGRMPYSVDGAMAQALLNIESTAPAPLPQRTSDPDAPWVDGEVSTIILKALAKDPARRYQTVAGLRDDIDHYLAGEAIEARRDSTWYMLRKTAWRHRVVVAATGLMFVMLAAFGAAMAWQAHRLAARGRELASALSNSNVERGRSLAAAGNIPLAEHVVWDELRRAGVTRIDGPEAGFDGSPEALHAYWALWEIHRSASYLATLHSQGEQVELLWFEEGGQRLNMVDIRGNLASWSVPTWAPVRAMRLVTPMDRVTLTAALSPSGGIAVFGAGMLRVIDPATGSVEAQAADPDNSAVTGAFSPDGSLLATIGSDNVLRLRDAHSLTTIATMMESTVCGAFPSHCKPAFSPDGSLVAAARPDGSVGLWSTASGVLARDLSPPDTLRRSSGPRRIAFAEDGTIAASPATPLHVVVWPPSGRDPVDLGAPGTLVSNLAFLPGSGGKKLISSGSTPGGAAGTTIVWSLPTASRDASFGQEGPAIACAASPDGRLIAIGDPRGNVRVCEVPPAPYVRVLQSSESWRQSVVAVNPDGRMAAFTAAPVGQAGRDVLLIDLKSGVTTSRFHRPGSGITCLQFALDGASLFEGDADGRITRRDLSTGAVTGEFTLPNPIASGDPDPQPEYPMAGLNQMRLSPDGTILARACNRDRRIGLWEAHSGRWIDWLDSGASGPAVIDFSGDGSTLVAHHPEKCVLWDVKARQPKRTIATEGYYPSVRCSFDGASIARAAGTHLLIFDAETDRILSENNVPGTAGMAMAFHPSAPVLFASARDQSIRLWDIRNGRELLSLQKHAAVIVSLALTPDGSTLISSDQSGMVLAWDLTYYNGPIRRELEYRAAHGGES